MTLAEAVSSRQRKRNLGSSGTLSSLTSMYRSIRNDPRYSPATESRVRFETSWVAGSRLAHRLCPHVHAESVRSGRQPCVEIRVGALAGVVASDAVGRPELGPFLFSAHCSL
jgi:hypothetical protein